MSFSSGLEKIFSSPEGAVFSRLHIPGTGINAGTVIGFIPSVYYIYQASVPNQYEGQF